MICQRCHQKDAEIHVKQITGGEVREFQICRSCAEEMGHLLNLFPKISISFSLHDALTPEPEEYGAPTGGGTCPKCGLDYARFRKTGKLGCVHCYEAFREVLAPLIERAHGSGVHRGSVPASVACVGEADTYREASRLREDLKKAIHDEEYEQAAALRDRIRSIEGA